MGLDVRLPVGVMFAIMGALLTGYGALGDRSIYGGRSASTSTVWAP
jgi:hypothetical protein